MTMRPAAREQLSQEEEEGYLPTKLLRAKVWDSLLVTPYVAFALVEGVSGGRTVSRGVGYRINVGVMFSRSRSNISLIIRPPKEKITTK